MLITPLRQQCGLSEAALARLAGISRSSLQRIDKGEWPSNPARAYLACKALQRALRNAGAPVMPVARLGLSLAPKPVFFNPQTVEASLQKQTSLDTPTPETTQEGDDPMLMQNTPISAAALRHFKMHRSPFVGDVNERSDVFETASVRLARAALRDAAQHHAFIALVGESGAGKTTLLEEFEQQVIDDERPIIIVRPYVLGMEQSDTKGKTLKASQIADALIAKLDPNAAPKRSSQAKFAQLHDLLKASAKAGNRHLLVIDEAHCTPTATLKHLKRFLELKDGMRRLLGVALVGQPELRRVLKSSNFEVREVMQRCEIVELEPLEEQLHPYLNFKFARLGLDADAIFSPDAIEALRTRLVRGAGGRHGDESLCYPLAVHNLVARCMNLAAQEAWETVDAQCVMGV